MGTQSLRPTCLRPTLICLSDSWHYDDYVQNKDVYSDRTDIGIPTEYKGKDIILPTRGQYPASGVPPMTPGVYNAGCVDFFVTPDEAFLDKYIPKNSIIVTDSSLCSKSSNNNQFICESLLVLKSSKLIKNISNYRIYIKE